MGQRIIIKAIDLLEAGCLVNQRIVYHPADPDGHFAEWQERQLVAYFPQNGEPVIFDFVVSDDKLTAEADYNEWGARYELLNPLLEAFKIPHTIV